MRTVNVIGFFIQKNRSSPVYLTGFANQSLPQRVEAQCDVSVHVSRHMYAGPL